MSYSQQAAKLTHLAVSALVARCYHPWPLMQFFLVVFISCKPPVDPVVLLEKHVNNVAQTGVTRTRYFVIYILSWRALHLTCLSHHPFRSTLRLTPVSNSCDANIPEIISLCKRIALPAFQSDAEGEPKSYRVSRCIFSLLKKLCIYSSRTI